MFLATVVLLAVAVALARGGKWSNLLGFKLGGPWLVIIALGLQLIIFNPVWDRHVKDSVLTNVLYVLSFVLLVAFIIVNIKVAGLRVLGLGALANGVAIIANGGYMPSSPDALKRILPEETITQLTGGSASYNVVLITDETRLKFLCDIFYIPFINVYSIGDILIASGAFLTIQQIMLRHKRINVL